MKVQPDTLAWKEAYKLLIGSVVPRPIAFVSTMDRSGDVNLAPFSFFTGICADPMMVCFAPMRKAGEGDKKDTLLNIEETKEFVINIVSEKIVEQMNECATPYAKGKDEFLASGLTKELSELISPPRVKESDVQLECTLDQIVEFGDHEGSGSLVIGKVVMVHVRDELYEDGRINTKKLSPVGRLAGQEYTRATADTFTLIRKTTANEKS
ncbi:flavin reductase family protein [Guptibacillus hwajinpoensis]|uniref:Flavin reductase (DIM6/NTAB) family NADH-FMN oxidoreductase RutF n=1 Tax=Guptibacillus hwajinpoensis TaxID=208199 RepID=A0ABU0K6Y2_9BACL|nr:flavin reductase family protein [Alkalihalobacillus hemicentroti]MDQ0485131.1 flavin reductase (DIM6/NTAB) family NADH-FMN oxidoreductase RutF [Alkalihalobacillus hemicentroti]